MIAVVGLIACHDAGTGPDTPPVVDPSLSFSGSANASDTIGVTMPQPLVVVVRDTTGAPARAGTVVTFTASVPGFREPTVILAAPTSPSYYFIASTTTDDAGRASILVRFENVAGIAPVAVSVPALGLVDTVRFTIKPGNAVRAIAAPFDTALSVGKSFTLRSGGIVDRAGNPRPDPVTWTSSAPGLTVTSAGVVTGAVVGRYQITAVGVGGPGFVPAAVSVVPAGKLLAWTGPSVTPAISTMDVDGSNETTLTTAVNGGVGPHPAWIPGTSTVVYTTVVNDLQTLYTVGADGVAKPFFSATPPNVTHEAEPTPSADGQWLYFTAYDTRCSASDYCVSRARIDGSAPELLVATPSTNPAPSPDGSKVAYRGSDGQIRVLDVATRTTSSWSVAGRGPAWSPDGTQIAYVTPAGTLAFVAPDGASGRTFASPAHGASPVWSPDGKWVVGSPNGMPTLIDPVTSLTLPLPLSVNKFVTSMK